VHDKKIKIVQVYLLSFSRETDHPYDYIAEGFDVEVGSIVGVDFSKSNRKQFAVVTEIRTDVPKFQLKNIIFVVSPKYSLSREMLGLCFYLKEQLFCSLGEAVRTVLPSGLTVNTSEKYILTSDFSPLTEQDIPKTALSKYDLSLKTLNGLLRTLEKKEKKLSLPKELIKSLVKKNIIKKIVDFEYKENEKNEEYFRLCEEYSAAENQDIFFKGLTKNKIETYKSLTEFLKNEKEARSKDLQEHFNVSPASLKTLTSRGILSGFRKKKDRIFYKQTSESELATLSDEQKNAFDELHHYLQNPPSAALLFGITGSGKTHVMLHLIDEALKINKSVIFLVPEIALTRQSLILLLNIYKDKVALLHSALSDGERHDTWLAIKQGEKKIVLGTRSAIFAPVENLGLIIIDEEQDTSYKSSSNLKYHAKDVARYRCAKENAFLLLASATPDTESYYKAKKGIYKLVKLTNRYNNAVIPSVYIEDMRKDDQNVSKLLGERLRNEISKNLENKQQTILFMNRRGYRIFLMCRNCSNVIMCPNCSVSLTLHNSKEKKLVCHYCGYTSTPPSQCPTCNSNHLMYYGYGTQKLEEEINELFPNAKVLRMDSDTVSKKGSHDKILTAFKNKDADILIGTQMVAKGHDFPDVTLVGVVTADSSLYMSDYRAYERTFSMLTQVIGRAGRSKLKGRAIIQTYTPYHEVLNLSTTQDYEKFYDGEIALRKAAIYPPFCSIAMFTLSSASENLLNQSALFFNTALEKLLNANPIKMIVYGPFDAPIYKLNGVYRKRFVIKYKNTASSRAIFKEIIKKVEHNDSKVNLSIDINSESI